MGFRNPILAGDVLIRNAIRSENYQFGVAGWIIRRDGSAEFSSALTGLLRSVGTTHTLDLILGQMSIHDNATGTHTITYDHSGILSDQAISIICNDLSTSTQLQLTPTAITVSDPITVFAETWHDLSLQNSWVNVGGNYDDGGYRFMPDGRVQFRGLIQGGTYTDGTVIATLPEAYRPSKEKHLTCNSSVPGATPVINLLTNGDMQIYRINAATGAVGLDCTSFDR